MIDLRCASDLRVEPVVESTVLPLARFAVPVSSVEDVRSTALGAPGTSCLDGRNASAAERVFPNGHLFKMGWVHTRSYSAEVINGESFNEMDSLERERESVSKDVLVGNRYAAVPVPVNAPDPEPASRIRLNGNEVLKSLGQRTHHVESYTEGMT